MNRCFSNILSKNVSATATFYEELLGMKRHFDSDWFVILTHANIEGLELGVLQRDHEIVPEAARAAPAGVMLTFVVDDCDAIHERALKQGALVVETPVDMPYGQRRMLLKDPDGTIVDVSAPTAPIR